MPPGQGPTDAGRDEAHGPGQPPPPEADLGPRVLAGAGWTVFLLLAVDRVAGGRLAELDPALLSAVPHEGPLHTASRLATHVGDPVTLAALALLGTILLLRRRAFLDAGLLLLAKAVSSVVVFGLKGAFGRLRPGLAGTAEACCAFPSGHATESAMVLMLLAVLLYEKRRRLRPWVEGIAIGAALVVGLTRLVLGVHWPTDVAAGWGLGWGLAGTILLLRAYLRRRLRLPWLAPEPDTTPRQAPLADVQATGGPQAGTPRKASNARGASLRVWTAPPGWTSTRPCASRASGSPAWTGAASAAPTRPRSSTTSSTRSRSRPTA